MNANGETKLCGLLDAGDPKGEVRMAWHAKEVVRSIYEHTNTVDVAVIQQGCVRVMQRWSGDCLVGGGSFGGVGGWFGSAGGSVAAAFEVDDVCGVDEPVEDRFGDDGVRE